MKEIEAWVARDRNGHLHLWRVKPVKFSTFWLSLEMFTMGYIRLPSLLLSGVKWSDEEPTKVKITIERCK